MTQSADPCRISMLELLAGPIILVPTQHGHKFPKEWTHKICPGCHFIYERAEFRTQTRCRPCRAAAHRTPQRRIYRRRYYALNREKAIAQGLAWKHAHRDRWLDANRKAKYGLAYGEYARILASQLGGCAICGTPPNPSKSHHVDHCHASGAIRGILCDTCNRGLGYFADSPDRLRAAAEYLESRK